MTDISVTIQRFSGFADQYDAYRPQTPPVILDILTQLAQVERPKLVVDLGSGTGLSTLAWAERAEAVIGVEPTADMRHQAEARTAALPNAAHVTYRAGISSQTGLPDDCADIVTCSQSLHWMEPVSTFAEVARILRPGGVFAAYDCDWPPTIHPDVELAYERCVGQVYAVERAQSLSSGLQSWDKKGHLARIRESGYFRYTKEIVLHHQELGNANRVVGLVLSQGSVMTALKNGLSESDLGLADLRAVARQVLGDELRPWYFSYRLRLGIT
jgi:ubiquinone/menaquinone biosynthesis C-methylase UbiE